jgi:hypothetical protein
VEIPSTLMWQIFKFGPKERKRRFDLEFSVGVIIKNVLRRLQLIFKEGPIRMATNLTLVVAQNSRKLILFQQQTFFATPSSFFLKLVLAFFGSK